jgi:hypothetical protein
MVVSTRIKLFGATILSGLSLMVVSCRITDPTGTRRLIETPSIKQYQAPDVPVPANFMHRPHDSYAYITGNVRTVSSRYIGSARTDELMDFYRKQMSQFGWIEKMTLGVDSKKAIAFQKQNEKCEIEIEQKSSETLLLVKIGFNNK